MRGQSRSKQGVILLEVSAGNAQTYQERRSEKMENEREKKKDLLSQLNSVVKLEWEPEVSIYGTDGDDAG